MNINYILEGSGDKTVVFIHGLSDSLRYWNPLAYELKDEYRILRYDIRGHGKSDWGDKPFTMDDLVEDLHNLLLSLDITRASLVGFSLGGNIALSFAVSYPEMVDRLILMSSFSRNDDNLTSIFLELRDLVDKSFEDFYDAIICHVLPKKVIDENIEVLEYVKHSSAEEANLDAIGNGIDIGIGFDITSKLKDISCPTLIIHGRDDSIVLPDLAKVLNDNIPDSQLVIFENTKHNLLIGNNVYEIIRLIRMFI